MVKKITFNKRGQVTIFVIVAVLLAAAVALFFLIFDVSPSINIGREFNPSGFVRQCIRDSAKDVNDIMILQGGFVNPEDYQLNEGIKATYLCKNINYFEPCVNQHPVLISELKEELKINIIDEIQGCFISLDEELRKRNYVLSGKENLDISISLKPGDIEIEVFRKFSMTKGDSSRTFDSFSATIRSPLYDLALIAQEIVKQEIQFCNFDYLGYSLLYNDFDIRKTSTSDSTKIYSIKDKKTGKEMNLAIRGCANPLGP